MLRIKDKKEIEEIIRRAIWTDRKLPKVGIKVPSCYLGSVIVSAEQRSANDFLADIPLYERPTQEDIKNWEIVMFHWLPQLDPISREIVFKRCSGMGWKSIAYQSKIDRITVWRQFKKALEFLLKK